MGTRKGQAVYSLWATAENHRKEMARTMLAQIDTFCDTNLDHSMATTVLWIHFYKNEDCFVTLGIPWASWDSQAGMFQILG